MHKPDVSGGGLTFTQQMVLQHLDHAGSRQVSDLARFLGISLSAVTGLVDRMTKAGLVTRDRDEGDRRVVWVKITPTGEEALKEWVRARSRRVHALFTQLEPVDLANLVEIIEKVARLTENGSLTEKRSLNEDGHSTDADSPERREEK